MLSVAFEKIWYELQGFKKQTFSEMQDMEMRITKPPFPDSSYALFYPRKQSVYCSVQFNGFLFGPFVIYISKYYRKDHQYPQLSHTTLG